MSEPFEPPAGAPPGPPPGGAPPVEPPAPPPGGEPPVPAPPGNPWEQRETLGFGTALIEAIKAFVTRPKEAYEATHRQGDFVSPILFALILGWAGVIVGQLWSLVFNTSFLPFLPPEARDQMGAMMAGSMMGFVIAVVLAPVFVLIGLFIWSGLVHLCLMLVGGLSEGGPGFEGTFRAIAYGSVSNIAQVVPMLGGLIAMVWGIVLYVFGLSIIHRTSQGKALAAVLIPIVLCCVCAGAIVAVSGVALVGALSGR